jgi:predicted short-subunit dehydrogenase-like oxidoreductase (DUF2520 family)
MIQHSLSFAGAGRVATALCPGFYNAGIRISKIVSRTQESGRLLAGMCKADWSKMLEFGKETDIIMVAVPDHLLQEVLSEIRCKENTIVAHTAGSFDLKVFPGHIKRPAVFYPLQTFTKGRKINFDNLPFFIEASGPDTEKILADMAETLGGKVYFTDSETRKQLHLAAVFACNFTNHMLTAGKEIAVKAGLDFSVLEPLIRETVAKALDNGPELSQTGPAIRNDQVTIKKHLELLSFSPEFQDLYRYITNSIIEYHKSDI